ncbi:MAG TPA: hypothetical protein VHM00_10575 [Caldimonas sp.]|nr:hypothetical protein [Caldimonas sp.]HEX2541514.1 hypothetical protein [Caldimonas sp.]
MDDAALLEPGTCQIEAWFERERSNARNVLHLGPGCRVGPVDVELSLDRVRVVDRRSINIVGAQVKWASDLGLGLSGGVVAAVLGADRSPRFRGSSVIVPLTWRPYDTLLVHLNAGRDLKNRDADSTRLGVALEWAPLSSGSFVAERFKDSRSNFWRIGARWHLRTSMSLDVSRATGLNEDSPPWWTLGLNWQFGR